MSRRQPPFAAPHPLWAVLAATAVALLLGASEQVTPAWRGAPARAVVAASPADAPDGPSSLPVGDGASDPALPSSGAESGAPAVAESAADVVPLTNGISVGTISAPDLAGQPGPMAPAQPIRVPRPAISAGPRRIGLQAGHLHTEEVPAELRRLEHATGTSWGSVAEWQVNLDIAGRVAAILRGRGYLVDVLPTVIPTGYLADVFVALHADGDTSGLARGYKAAHGARRGPYEDQLVRDLVAEYGRATGLPLDPQVSRNMLGYYAFSWTRFLSSVAPHTPAAILEMGFLTNAADRTMLLGRTDLVADGVAAGLLRFLDEVPAGAAFAEDLLVAPLPAARPGTAPGTPGAPRLGAPPR